MCPKIFRLRRWRLIADRTSGFMAFGGCGGCRSLHPMSPYIGSLVEYYSTDGGYYRVVQVRDLIGAL